MNMEKMPEPGTKLEQVDSDPLSSSLNKIKERDGDVGKKIDNETGSLLKSLEGLPANKTEEFEARTRSLQQKVKNMLALSAAAAFVGIASPALAQQASENDVEKLSPTTNIEDVSESNLQIAVDAATLIVKDTLKEKVTKAEKNVKILTNEKPSEKTADALKELATEAPIISNIISKKIPFLSALSDLEKLQQLAKDPVASKADVWKQAGKTFLNLQTLGFGNVVMDYLFPDKKPDVFATFQNGTPY